MRDARDVRNEGEGRARTEITKGGEGMEYPILWPSRALRVLTTLGELRVSACPHRLPVIYAFTGC